MEKNHFFYTVVLWVLVSSGLCLFSRLSVSSPSAVHEYRLSNGLRLFVKEDHRSPAVISQIWYKVGSSYEPQGITGISHALEHMMFRGTETVGPGAFSKAIAAHGGRLNAFTDYDVTAYYEELPSFQSLKTAFELEADRMKGLLLDPAVLKKEIQVVMEERRMRTDDNPQALTHERFLAAAHVGSPYHHPVIGWMHDLLQMNAADLRKWYEQWYAPNNALIVVVGDVVPDKVYTLAKRYFDGIKPETLPVSKSTVVVEPLGERTVVVKKPARLPYLIMGYNVPVLKTATLQWEPYALSVLNALLSDGRSARFSKLLVRKKQIANYALSEYDPYSRLPGLITFFGVPAKGFSVNALRQAIESQVGRLQREQVSQKELNRVKQQMIARDVFKKDSMSGQAFEIGALESVGLSWREGEAWLQRIQSVTSEQVQAVAKKYLQDRRLTVAMLVPQPMPSDTMKRPHQTNKTLGNAHVR